MKTLLLPLLCGAFLLGNTCAVMADQELDPKRLGDELHLSSSQRETIGDLIFQHREQAVALQHELWKSKLILQEGARSETSPKKLEEAAEQLGKATGALALKRVQLQRNISNALTPAQQKDFFEMIEDRADSKRERMGEHFGRFDRGQEGDQNRSGHRRFDGQGPQQGFGRQPPPREGEEGGPF